MRQLEPREPELPRRTHPKEGEPIIKTLARTDENASFTFPETTAKTVGRIFGNPMDFAPGLAVAKQVAEVAKGSGMGKVLGRH